MAGRTYLLARPLGINSNNYAEYMAVLVGVKYASFIGATKLDIYCDSKVVVEQIKGHWQCKEPRLRILKTEVVLQLDKLFTDWDIHWVGRAKNTIADAACTKAIRLNNPWLPNHLDPFAPLFGNRPGTSSHRKYRRNPYALR